MFVQLVKRFFFVFQNNDKVSLVVARKKCQSTTFRKMSTETLDEVDAKTDTSSKPDNNGLAINHVRSKSAPAIHHKNGASRRNGQVPDFKVIDRLVEKTLD